MMLKIIKKLIEVDNKNKYTVYTNESQWVSKTEQIIPAKPWDALADLNISKEFKKENFWLMVFFDHRVPLFYKEDFVVVIPSLKESFFMGKDFLQREIYNYYMKKTIARAKRIICFEKYTASELNERLNVKEEKIKVMKPFFDVQKEKELGKIKKSWKKVHLFMLWEETSKDTEIRDLVIAAKLQDRVDFIATLPAKEEAFYYHQSRGVIFPTIYESFPFELKTAIKYWCPILASDIGPIKEFMWKHIDYFNPKSTHDMEDAINKFLKKKKKPDYKDIFSDLTLPKTIKEFYAIIMKA